MTQQWPVLPQPGSDDPDTFGRGTADGLIPYVDNHDGPRRRLDVDTTGASSHRVPQIAIDGRNYVVYYGRVSFEVPADRPVHVAAWVNSGDSGLIYSASHLLLPQHAPLLVWRKVGSFSMEGQFLAPGPSQDPRLR